jgi:hypothetical protein
MLPKRKYVAIKMNYEIVFATIVSSGKSNFILNPTYFTFDNYSYTKYSTTIMHLLLFHFKFESVILYKGALRIAHY